MLELKDTKQGIQFKIKVQPRAAKNELAGMLNDALKVRLTSPPVDGEANAACIKFFANLFRTSKGNISIISGETARNKIIQVQGLSLEEVQELLADVTGR